MQKGERNMCKENVYCPPAWNGGKGFLAEKLHGALEHAELDTRSVS